MRAVVLLLFCSVACAADTEDLEGANAKRDAEARPNPDGGVLRCEGVWGDNCCGDSLIQVDCSKYECVCPPSAVPEGQCRFCPIDAGGPPPQVACQQVFGSCCSDAVQLFDCTTAPCACPQGFAPSGCNQCNRPDAG